MDLSDLSLAYLRSLEAVWAGYRALRADSLRVLRALAADRGLPPPPPPADGETGIVLDAWGRHGVAVKVSLSWPLTGEEGLPLVQVWGEVDKTAATLLPVEHFAFEARATVDELEADLEGSLLALLERGESVAEERLAGVLRQLCALELMTELAPRLARELAGAATPEQAAAAAKLQVQVPLWPLYLQWTDADGPVYWDVVVTPGAERLCLVTYKGSGAAHRTDLDARGRAGGHASYRGQPVLLDWTPELDALEHSARVTLDAGGASDEAHEAVLQEVRALDEAMAHGCASVWADVAAARA